MSAYPSVATHSAIAQDEQNPCHPRRVGPCGSDLQSQLPQPHLDTIEEASKEQGIAGEHPEPNDDDLCSWDLEWARMRSPQLLTLAHRRR
jgi:hypothetical protein